MIALTVHLSRKGIRRSVRLNVMARLTTLGGWLSQPPFQKRGVRCLLNLRSL